MRTHAAMGSAGALIAALVLHLPADAAAGACEPAWLPTFGGEPGVGASSALCMVELDGALYVGGSFHSAGGVLAHNVARWDGAAWSALGAGTSGSVFALAVFDDGGGDGPALYAGGNFTDAGGLPAPYVAKWDGTQWSAVGAGTDQPVRDLFVHDDGRGAGAALYAGGTFTMAGGAAANRIARWDGAQWSALGSGVTGTSLVSVYALAGYDDGSGAGHALYAAGHFAAAGGASASCVARWDGSIWSPLGSGVSGSSTPTVEAMAVYDDGSGAGPALFVGGSLSIAGGHACSKIARWDGASWSGLQAGTSSDVSALTVHDDGTGPALYAGGTFTFAGGRPADRIARWDGSQWSTVGDGANYDVEALAVHDDGTGGGPLLFAAGDFTSASGVVAHRVARWDGAEWSSLGAGMNGAVAALAVYDDGSGTGALLHAAGAFTTTADGASNRIARRLGAHWEPLGSGLDDDVVALAVHDDGSGAGPALYAGGSFTSAGGVPANRIARWDGRSWSPLGSGTTGSVKSLSLHDDGSGSGAQLYAGGSFGDAGGASANRVAKWDGALWSPLGSGMNADVLALASFDDGSGAGPALYAGGNFTAAGGVTVNHIARWDGVQWSDVGGGVSMGPHGTTVMAFAVHDDGSGGGPALYVGGRFGFAGAAPAASIARWDGATWSALGGGIDGWLPTVIALVVHDDGTGGGPALYAGGLFDVAGGAPASQIARWSGGEWSALGSGTSDLVYALAVHDAGAGTPSLYAGGGFGSAIDAQDSYIARWGCDEPACPADIDGSGTVGFADLTALLLAWGACPPAFAGNARCAGDLDGSGAVGFGDITLLLIAWGPCD